MIILIAGGTGFIGKQLSDLLVDNGHKVFILTRNPSDSHHIFWNPQEGEMPFNVCFDDIQVLINLTGEGINEKRWTAQQKKLLYTSRIVTTHLLFEKKEFFPKLEQYISASGITAYPFDDGIHLWKESESFGDSYIAQLVKDWESSANLFSSFVPVCILRIAVVLGSEGGALPLFTKLTKLGVGGSVGHGKQQMPWIHLQDLVAIFINAVEEKWEGVFNTNAGNISNVELMEVLRSHFGKKMTPPSVPGFLIRLLFGERSILMLKGNKACNKKIINKGFSFRSTTIKEVLLIENL